LTEFTSLYSPHDFPGIEPVPSWSEALNLTSFFTEFTSPYSPHDFPGIEPVPLWSEALNLTFFFDWIYLTL